MTASDAKIERASSLNGETFISYSRNFEDVILNRLFPIHKTGFYVDVGAGQPRFENDTFFLYQRGWRGINIEPNRELHTALVRDRPRDTNLQLALSDQDSDAIVYYELAGSGLSTCDAEMAAQYKAVGRNIVPREIPAATLSDVLANAGVDHINILKVDVEGFEEKVLNGNNWEKFRPDVVMVAVTYYDRPLRRPTGILDSMKERGYRHIHFDGLNDFYLERDFRAPEGLSLPPNVFDRFLPHHLAEVQSRLSEALRAMEALATENRQIGHRVVYLTTENRRLQNGAEQMRTEILALNRLLEQLGALAAADARLKSVYSSLSWRLTKPLRWCDAVLRRLAARFRRLHPR